MTTYPIRDYRSAREAQTEACRRWDAGNNAGLGYDPGDSLACARIILAPMNDRDVTVYRLPDGREIAVACANGLWAVEITPRRAAR